MNLEPIHSEPDAEEIAARVGRLRARMAEEGLDWYVAFEPTNIRYLTNFDFTPHERPYVLLISARGDLKFVGPKVDVAHIRRACIGPVEFVEYLEFPAPAGEAWFDRMRGVLGAAARIGVESTCPLQVVDALPATHIRADIIDELRAVKSPYEIRRMVHAGNLVSAAMRDLLANARAGRNVTEVGQSCHRLLLELLAAENPLAAPGTITGGAWFQSPRYSHDPHDFSDRNMTMERGGPHVSIINAVLDGYGSEIERTFFIGQVPEAAKRPFETMMRARRLALEMVKPGVPMSDIDKAVRALCEAAGYGDNLCHRTGHGMGLTAHEGPFLADGDPHILCPGMCFTVEPGIYVKGVGGFRHSDTVLVTEAGSVLLTAAPESLEDMTLPEEASSPIG